MTKSLLSAVDVLGFAFFLLLPAVMPAGDATSSLRYVTRSDGRVETYAYVKSIRERHDDELQDVLIFKGSMRVRWSVKGTTSDIEVELGPSELKVLKELGKEDSAIEVGEWTSEETCVVKARLIDDVEVSWVVEGEHSLREMASPTGKPMSFGYYGEALMLVLPQLAAEGGVQRVADNLAIYRSKDGPLPFGDGKCLVRTSGGLTVITSQFHLPRSGPLPPDVKLGESYQRAEASLLSGRVVTGINRCVQMCPAGKIRRIHEAEVNLVGMEDPAQ